MFILSRNDFPGNSRHIVVQHNLPKINFAANRIAELDIGDVQRSASADGKTRGAVFISILSSEGHVEVIDRTKLKVGS